MWIVVAWLSAEGVRVAIASAEPALLARVWFVFVEGIIDDIGVPGSLPLAGPLGRRRAFGECCKAGSAAEGTMLLPP